MNDDPHLMALIDDKMAQARTSRRHGDPERAGALLEQARIYAAFLGSGEAETGLGRRAAGTTPPLGR